MLSVLMLNVDMLNVVMLTVVAPSLSYAFSPPSYLVVSKIA
jgi:hypothetical protein